MRRAGEAETALLSLCFKHPDCHRRAKLEITPEHFADDALRDIWHAASKHEPPLDLTLVAESVQANGGLQRIGGKARLAAVSFAVADKTRFDDYIRVLHEARAHRRLYRTLDRAKSFVDSSKGELPEVTAKVTDMLSEALKGAVETNDGLPLAEVLTTAFSESYAALERQDGIRGFRTHVRAIDDMIGGFEPGHVTTLMGEPGTGKTALALQAAIGASQHVPVGFISLEMSAADLGQRIQACTARVNYTNIRNGNLNEDAHEALGRVSTELSESRNLWLAPATVESWAESQAWMTHMYYAHGVRLFMLDNVLSLDYAGKDEYEHVTAVANASQRLVKKLGVALLNLHHTNTSEKPTLRAAHSAKAIARHSSNVLALWREDMEDTSVLLMELKGRNTGRGERLMRFIPHEQRFAEYW